VFTVVFFYFQFDNVIIDSYMAFLYFDMFKK